MFLYEKQKVIIDPLVLATMPPLERLYNEDKSDGKETAMAKLKLIFHMVDPRSPYNTSASYTRFTKVIHDLFPNLIAWEKTGVKEDKIYIAALNCYRNTLDLIPERALLTAAQDAVHDLATKISDPATKDKEDLLGKMSKAMENMQKVKDMVKAEEDKAQSTKGKHHIRRREDPEYYENKK